MAVTKSRAQVGFRGKEGHHCTFCYYKCNSKSRLEEHLRTHTGEKPFLCSQCNRGFSVKWSLKSHITRVHDEIKPVYEKKYKCSVCPYATHTRYGITVHTRRHKALHSFPCHQPNCEYAATSSSELKRHITGKHGVERKYVCRFPNCGYRGKTYGVLRQHYFTHSEVKPFFCDVPECNYRAKRKDSLQKHKLGVHNGGHKPFACSTCSHRTSCKFRLKNHELTHSKEKSIKCSFTGCTFSFKTKTRLNDHVQNCHTERHFKCDFAGCLSTAATRHKLELHKKNVHYDKVHQCPHCDFRAAVPSKLQLHIVRHNLSRRIPCRITGCAFKSKNRETVHKHVRHHKANLDCRVEGCGYVGTSKLGLKRHLKVHDPTGRRFHCSLCPKHYHTNGGLQYHLRCHTQEKPFQCPVCSYGASRKMDITRHVRTIHSNLFSGFVCDEKFICDHCCVNFGSAIGLAIHTIKLKTPVVELTRLQLKFDC